MWNVSWLCNRFSHKHRRATESRNHHRRSFHFIQELTHSPWPPRLFNYLKKETISALERVFMHHWRETVWLCGLAQPEHLRNSGVKTGSWEVSWIDFFFSQVWLGDTPNLLTHIHPTLLCTGLKCVWERERQENRTPSVCYVMLNGWKKKEKNTCSVGQPLQL